MRLFFTLFFCFCSSIAFAKPDWQPLQTGLDYYHFVPDKASAWSHIQSFRIDPKQYHLKLAFARDQQLLNSSVKTLTESNNALIGINGGFFAPDFSPIGLRINQGKTHHPAKTISWWGIFYMQDNLPRISSQWEFKSQANIQLAVQSGPRLLVNGRIPKLKPGEAQRTAIGITKSGHIVIMVTQNYPMTLPALAAAMRDQLECQDALNLDGGSSTQLYAKIGVFNLAVPGYSNIADAVLVTPK